MRFNLRCISIIIILYHHYNIICIIYSIILSWPPSLGVISKYFILNRIRSMRMRLSLAPVIGTRYSIISRPSHIIYCIAQWRPKKKNCFGWCFAFDRHSRLVLGAWYFYFYCLKFNTWPISLMTDFISKNYPYKSADSCLPEVVRV